MILETAVLYVKPGTMNEFESKFRQASKIIARAAGYIGHELHKCVEESDKYLLLVQWGSITDHVVGFRQSEDFEEWRSLLHPFYVQSPSVQHYVKIKL